MSRRTLDTQKFSANLRSDRAAVSEIREERIRVGGTLGMGMSAWRGRSGRRWVVSVRPLRGAEAYDLTDAVVLGVSRDVDGTARILFATHSLSDEAAVRLLRTLKADGVTELHLHRVSTTDVERDAMVEDVTSVLEVA